MVGSSSTTSTDPVEPRAAAMVSIIRSSERERIGLGASLHPQRQQVGAGARQARDVVETVGTDAQPAVRASVEPDLDAPLAARRAQHEEHPVGAEAEVQARAVPRRRGVRGGYPASTPLAGGG